MRGGREPVAERIKRIATIVAERTIERIEKLRDRVAARPWDAGKELKPEEQLALFAEIVNDPVAWGELIQRERQLFHLRPDVIPKRLFKEAVQMYEKLNQSGGAMPALPAVEEETDAN